MTIEHTIISYPTRGSWGDATYRGNFSGYMVKDLIEWRKPRLVFDPMAGSDTTKEVCKTLNVPYIGGDLKEGFDILDVKAQQEMYKRIYEESDGAGADLIIFHPPYWTMIKYSGNRVDFSNGPYSLWLTRMDQALQWLRKLMVTQDPTVSLCDCEPDVEKVTDPVHIINVAHQLGCSIDRKPPAIALLLADLRKHGMDRTYFLTDDATSTATMAKARLQKEVRIIKIQHNTTTAGRMEDLDIKMAHEYLTIMIPRSL